MPENALFSVRAAPSRPGGVGGSAPPGRAVRFDRLWDGRRTPESEALAVSVWSEWDDQSLRFHFSAAFTSLETRPDWGEQGPVDRLWEADVVEVFLQPEGSPGYFEFEVSPLGQWIDLHVLEPRKKVDFGWRSGLSAQVAVDHRRGIWDTRLEIPYDRLLADRGPHPSPRPGEAWRLNLFRAAGCEPERSYLSWRPTFTPEPDFHVPSSFGVLLFVGAE